MKYGLKKNKYILVGTVLGWNMKLVYSLKLNLTEIYIKLLKSIGNYMYQLLQK
jgi:hypothetical protein